MTPGWKLIPEAAGIFGIELIHQFDQILVENRQQRGVTRISRQNAKKNGKQKDPAVWKLGILKIKLRFLQKKWIIYDHIISFVFERVSLKSTIYLSVYKYKYIQI